MKQNIVVMSAKTNLFNVIALKIRFLLFNLYMSENNFSSLNLPSLLFDWPKKFFV